MAQKKKTQTAKQGGSGSQKSKNPPPVAAPVTKVQVALKPPEQPVQQQKEGKTLRLHQKELVIRLTGLERYWAIPLHPGRSGAPRLDALARQHAWSRWMSAPKITYRSLSGADSPVICSYLVVHDATLAQINQPTYWDTLSRQYTANKASVSFTHAVDLTAIVNKHLTNQSDSCSWFLFKFDGPQPVPAELWLEYDVEFGGIADLSRSSITFHVKNGKFYEEGSTEPLEGYPVLGRDTSYHFGGAAPTREQIKHLLEDIKAIPLQITRPNTNPPTVANDSPVREVSFHIPQSVVDFALGVASNAFVQKAFQVIKPILRAVVKKETLNQKTFDDYNGTVTVQTAIHGWYAASGESTTPPIPRYSLTDQKSMSDEYPLIAQYSRDSTALKDTINQMARLLANAGIAFAIENMFRKLKNKSLIVHRGAHARNFLLPLSGWGTSVPDPPTDGGPENPNLPDVPETDGDVESPGVIVPWSAAQKFFSGYVVDNNGTPITHYLSAEKHGVAYFSAITPRYYVNVKRPWDTENKRLLAFQVKVSEALKGHYLLMEGYNWGDDACASWLGNVGGATYMGCAARFSGITESRSVIRVDDPESWNNSEVHLVVGQAKDKYRKVDKGRASLFAVRIGAVGLYEVAMNYLAVFTKHKSVTRMKNHPLNKGSGAGAIVTFPTHMDFNLPRDEPDPNLDANSPGFGMNYSSLVMGTRALPYPLEDGPVRATVLARYDDANGWWQHVPDAAWTDTDIASYWNFLIKMDGTDTSTATGIRQVYDILRMTTPPQFTENAYLCTEMITLGGSEAGITTRLTALDLTYGDNHIVTGISPGPLMIMRTVLKLKKGQLVVHSVGDTSRPTTAVEGFERDIYVSFVSRSYLVKDLDIAKRWALWDTPGIGEDMGEYKWFRPTFKVEPNTPGNPWTIGDEITGLDFYVFTSNNAPCKSTCSAWSDTGYSIPSYRHDKKEPGEVEKGIEDWFPPAVSETTDAETEDQVTAVEDAN